MFQIPAIIYAVFAFVFGKIGKVAFHASIITFQLFIVVSILAFVIFYTGFVTYALMKSYNIINDLFVYLSSSSSDSVLSCSYGVLSCSGISSAFQNGINLFFSVIVIVLIMHLLRLYRSSMLVFSDQLYKLGVLIGQVLS